MTRTTDNRAGGPSLHCTIPTEGAPSLRILQGAAMLPAQLLSDLHYPLCMPSQYPAIAKYAKNAPAAVVASAGLKAKPPAAKVRILRFKNLPPFRQDRGLQNHV